MIVFEPRDIEHKILCITLAVQGLLLYLGTSNTNVSFAFSVVPTDLWPEVEKASE